MYVTEAIVAQYWAKFSNGDSSYGPSLTLLYYPHSQLSTLLIQVGNPNSSQIITEESLSFYSRMTLGSMQGPNVMSEMTFGSVPCSPSSLPTLLSTQLLLIKFQGKKNQKYKKEQQRDLFLFGALPLFKLLLNFQNIHYFILNLLVQKTI